VAEAYDLLSDPETRKRYDAYGQDFRQVPEGVDPDTWARARAGQQRSRGPGGPGGPGVDEQWFTPGGEGIDLDDLLGGMFGRQRRGWGPVRGANQEAELVLSVDEAYRGGRRTITLSGAEGPRSYDVNIPAGVTDGQRIRLAGQGGQGTAQAPAGDLYLVVRIAPHRRYRVEGRDIYVELPVAPWEAALGATVPTETPAGEAKVRVPAGSSSGRRLRLRRRGMPNPRGEPGDFFAEVRIMVPSSLSDEEHRLFEELAKTSTFDPRKKR
jgi:curved DNA-binding protein